MLQMVNGCPLTKNEKWFFVSLDSNGMDYYYEQRKISTKTTTTTTLKWILFLVFESRHRKTWYLLKSFHWWLYTYSLFSEPSKMDSSEWSFKIDLQNIQMIRYRIHYCHSPERVTNVWIQHSHFNGDSYWLW